MPRRLLPPLAALLAGAVAVAVWRRPAADDASPPPGPAVRFTDVTAAAGLRFAHTTGAAGRKLLPETMGAGVVVLDYDGDGRPDLFFPNGRPWPGHPGGRPTQALYRNRGDGTFEDATAAAGLGVTLYGMGAAAGDFDNDGRPDLYVTAVGGDRLFRNAGGRFEDVSAAAGLAGGPLPDVSAEAFLAWDRPIPFPASCAWLDYDGDGRPDLFACRYLTWSPAADLGVRAELAGGQRAYVPPQQFPGADCVLLRNLGGGRFEDVSAAAGVAVSDGVGPAGKALGVVVCDPDRDGRPDLVVACDTVRNLFFHNVPGPGGGRRFREEGMAAGLAYADGRPRGGMGIDAAHLGPDRFAVLVANFSNEPDSLFTPLAPGRLRFADAAAAAGLAGPSRPPMKFGALLFDFDGDGRPDLLTANGHLEPDIAAAQPGQTFAQPAQLYWNAGGDPVQFRPVGPETAGGDLFAPMVGRGAAVIDYDGDGDPDLILTVNGGPPRLLRNDGSGRWLRLTVAGDGRAVSRDAVGAEVEVEAGGVVQRLYVSPARGYLSGGDPTLLVGLGPAAAADRVTVRWPQPAGGERTWRDLPAGPHRLAFEGR
jgi:hypothetical protein